MSLTLYHNDMSVCSAKVRMAMAEKQLAWEGIHLNLRAGEAQRPEYVKLNPNQVVPTLVHDGVPIIESSIICEYLEEVFPQVSLLPCDAIDRVRMRLWVKQVDDAILIAIGIVSACIAFRYQHLARRPEELAGWLENMVDPAKRLRTRLAIEHGMDSPDFAPAVLRFERLLNEMEETLASHAWLAGDSYSLADLTYASYMTRLQHLGFMDRILARPRTAAWTERLFNRPAYEEGIRRWFNPKYLELFDTQREAARQRINRIAGA
jgi:glutathione S-transferase